MYTNIQKETETKSISMCKHVKLEIRLYVMNFNKWSANWNKPIPYLRIKTQQGLLFCDYHVLYLL